MSVYGASQPSYYIFLLSYYLLRVVYEQRAHAPLTLTCYRLCHMSHSQAPPRGQLWDTRWSPCGHHAWFSFKHLVQYWTTSHCSVYYSQNSTWEPQLCGNFPLISMALALPKSAILDVHVHVVGHLSIKHNLIKDCHDPTLWLHKAVVCARTFDQMHSCNNQQFAW